MIRRMPAILNRALATTTVVAIFVWTLSAVVWAGAGLTDRCPMHELTARDAAEALDDSCCSTSVPSDSEGGIESPCGPKSCCCPAVAPAIPGPAVMALLPFVVSEWADFPEPVMVDRLAADELIIPPAS